MISGVKVAGRESVQKLFDDVLKALGPKGMKEALLPAAEVVRDDAKRRVKIGPGETSKGQPREHLASLIFAAPGKRGDRSVIVGVDRKKAPHAHLVEGGHGGLHPAPPHQYLRPALQSTRSQVKAKAESGLRALLSRFVSR